MAKRKFGVELEYRIPRSILGFVAQKVAKGTGFEASPRDDTRRWSFIEEYGGSELTSPILDKISTLRKAVEIIKKELPKASRQKTAKSCQEEVCDEGFGLHVHIDARDLMRKYKRSFFFLDFYHLLTKMESYLILMHPRYRRDSVWVTPLRDNRVDLYRELEGSISGLDGEEEVCCIPARRRKNGWWNKLTGEAREVLQEEYLDIMGMIFDKESCVSFNTLGEHGTLEFRFGVSSLNPQYITRWVELCRLVVERSVPALISGKIPELKTFDSFLRWLKPSQGLKTWMKNQYKTMGKIESPCSLPV